MARFLHPKKTLFLLCDIQSAFRPGMALFDNMVENANKLVRVNHLDSKWFKTRAGKELEIPLIATEHYPEKLGKIVPELDIQHAAAIVGKTRFSMLVPQLETKMKELFGDKPNDVVLYGLESHICVEQTAIDFLERNVNVFIVADCCCSRLTQDRDLALQRLRQAGCVITTSESVIFNLMRDKNHPKFNIVRKLINNPSVDMQLSINGASKL